MHYPSEWRTLNWCDCIFIQTDVIDDQVIQTHRCYRDINVHKWTCSPSWNPRLLCYFKFEAPKQNSLSLLYTLAFHSRLIGLSVSMAYEHHDMLGDWSFLGMYPDCLQQSMWLRIVEKDGKFSLNQITAHKKVMVPAVRATGAAWL